jgi:hypothetical protein
MNQNQELKELAAAIFVKMVAEKANPKEHHWQQIAENAIEAAVVFTDTFNERCGPKTPNPATTYPTAPPT